MRLAARHGASASLCEDVALAVSEAVNNAVLHAYGGKGGEVHLVVDVIDDALEILVADQGYGFGEGPKSSGLGVGLRVIAELADTFSIDPGREAGVEVRMRFLLR
ncbi:MAG: putative anti-sigma regulatory factor, serine/threonine protein kinase [Solirubrobacterales bacterium]|nr:putative anti-sigma regulatory factor, serine/threonine protein kinase [Solirubrobacterales bacterium]